MTYVSPLFYWTIVIFLYIVYIVVLILFMFIYEADQFHKNLFFSFSHTDGWKDLYWITGHTVK